MIENDINLPPIPDHITMLDRAGIRNYARAAVNVNVAALISLLVDIRFAAGDNGKRMQDELVEHIRELRCDADRMDWISKYTRCDPDMGGNHHWWPSSFNQRIRGATFRAAIDAAMEEQS